jgi:hypothetical protein
VSRYSAAEARVFAVATLVCLVHAIDDAFVHPGPGLGLGQHALAGAISIAAAAAGIAVFPSLRPGLRAAIAFVGLDHREADRPDQHEHCEQPER